MIYDDSFLGYYFRSFTRPSSTFRSLISGNRYFRYSFGFIAIPIAAYTLMYIFLFIAGGAPSVFTPWLNISREDYYSANRFLLGPSMLMCWVLASAVIQMISRSSGGTGTFEQTLSVIALSISVAMWGGLIHDLPMSFFSAIHVIDARQHEIAMNSPTIWRTLLWTCYSVYFLAFLILFPLSVRVVHKLPKGLSFLIGLIGFVIFQLVFLIFNR